MHRVGDKVEFWNDPEDTGEILSVDWGSSFPFTVLWDDGTKSDHTPDALV